MVTAHMAQPAKRTLVYKLIRIQCNHGASSTVNKQESNVKIGRFCVYVVCFVAAVVGERLRAHHVLQFWYYLSK